MISSCLFYPDNFQSQKINDVIFRQPILSASSIGTKYIVDTQVPREMPGSHRGLHHFCSKGKTTVNLRITSGTQTDPKYCDPDLFDVWDSQSVPYCILECPGPWSPGGRPCAGRPDLVRGALCRIAMGALGSGGVPVMELW